MAKKTSPQYDPSAAYAAAGAGQSDPSMGTDPTDPSQAPTDPSAGGGQPLTIPPDQVAQLEQLKQSGDMASLGQAIASLLP